MASPNLKSSQQAKRELSEKQLSYVIWSAMPEGLRQPEDANDFAAMLGISRQTMWRWGKDPRILDAVRFVVLQNAGDPARVTKVLDMVYDMAIGKSNLKAAELWIKAVGLTNQFTRGNSILDALDDEDSFKDFSLEELERLKNEMDAQKLEEDSIAAARRRLADLGSYDDVVPA